MLKKSLKIAFLSILLVGCTKAANLSVQALSSTLVQMKSTFANPFTQNYDTNKYAVFSGQCLNIITSLQISFNEGPWLNVPSSATSLNGNQTINSVVYPYTETLTPSGTYDVDCSDGSFYFWIYSHQFDQMVFDSLGMIPSNSQVYKISIRGVSGSFATEPTVYNSPNFAAPSQIALYKGGPTGAAANTCAYFIVSLEDANGKNAKYSSDIPFSLSHSINSTSDTPTFYSSDADCLLNSPGAALLNGTLKIPAQQSEFYLFYHVPSTAATGDLHNFSVIYGGSPISLGTAHGSLSMTIKASTTQYIDIAAPYQMVPNLCYPFIVNLRTYGGANVNSSAETFSISSASDLQVFSTPGCSPTAATSFTFAGASTIQLYLKLNSTATVISGALQISNVNYETDSVIIDYDMTGGATASKVAISGMSNLNGGAVSNFRVSLHNNNGTPIPSSTATNVSLSTDTPPDKGYFCSGSAFSSCPSISSVSIPVGEYFTNVTYKAIFGGPVVLTPTVSGLASRTSLVYVTTGVTQLGFSITGAVANNSCVQVDVQALNSLGALTPAPVFMNITLSGFPAGNIYLSPSCSAGTVTGISISSGSSSTTFYWRLLSGTYPLSAASPGVTNAVQTFVVP